MPCVPPPPRRSRRHKRLAARGPPLGQTMDSPAEQFAAWLPYTAYLADEKLFVNRDSLGFMLEVMPQSGADERMAEVLISLYSTCPPGTGIQFHLFASPHVREQLRRYANLRVEDTDQADKARHWGRPARNDNLFHRLARQRVGHLLQRCAGVADGRLPLHDPRLPADDERGAARRRGRSRRPEPARRTDGPARVDVVDAALGLAAQPGLRRRRPDQLVRAVHQPGPHLADSSRATRPSCSPSTTTTAARSATRSSTSTPSRTRTPAA